MCRHCQHMCICEMWHVHGSIIRGFILLYVKLNNKEYLYLSHLTLKEEHERDKKHKEGGKIY